MKNNLGKRIISLLLVAFIMISFVPMTKIEAEAANAAVENAVNLAVSIAKNNYYGYHLGARHGNPHWCSMCKGGRMSTDDFDCSSFVCYVFQQAGFNVPITTTHYMKTHFKNAGFTWIDGLNDLRRGDIILNQNSHVAIYLGDNKIVHASANYNNVAGGAGGEDRVVTGYSSTGADEITVRTLYSFGATGVLRYGGSTTTTESKVIGTYRSNNSGVYIRSIPSISGNRLGLVPSYTEIYVTETNYNWGKCTYNGVTGWTCLDYYTQVSIPDATTPTITSITASDMAQGGVCTITWGGASNAARYAVSVNDGPEIDCGTNTSYPYTLSEAKTYTFKVRAYNSVNKESSWSGPVSCKAHAPSTVTFVDDDGALIDKVVVDYGKNASSPAPSKQGHTFQGWDGSTYNITKDVTLKAQYSVNTYNVKFWGTDENQLGETQKIKYGEDATPPGDTEAPAGYKFVRWSSEEYKNVYTDSNDKTINIYAIYEWANENIPITCEITEAYRDSDGYHVLYDIKNNVEKTQTGRAIISLKTAEGKLIFTTESKTFRLPGNSSKTNIDEFFECEETASVIEIIIVDSYKTGTPISENVSKTVTDGLGWSNWQDGEAPEGVESEERTVYRYRDKETTTANTKNLNGWEYNGVASQSSSSGNSWNLVTAIYTDAHIRSVSTNDEVYGYNSKTQYRYSHWTNGSAATPTWVSGRTQHFTEWSDTCKYHKNTLQYNGGSYPRYWNGSTWGYCNDCGRDYFPWYNEETRQVENYNSPIIKTKYYYTDTYYTYNFWRWKNWSDWSVTETAETSTRDVEVKTQYRTYNGVEDTSGKTLEREYFVGTEFAGKQVTLFVYKFDAASDYTDEFVGQTKVDSEGYCTFNIKLREEPSIQTGDFTFALGIEGTTNTFVVDTLKAPVPEYTVNFYDWDGNIVETQTVKEGENAVLPSFILEKEGYDFVGWSESLTNIRQDTDIFADMEKREYQVIFVDWENQLIEIQTFEHGDVLVTPDIAEFEGHTFKGWDEILEGNILVTSNMVVSTVYEANTYTVSFCDYDGNVIDVQEVEYGNTALPPEDVESEDGKQFAGWFNPENYEHVEKNITVFPSYYFEETCEIPKANYKSGEFSETIELTLTSDDENAVIYYYLNGDKETEAIYTHPIVIEKTTAITFYATSLGKNDSEEETNYYCINTASYPSEWMLNSALPEKVKVNPDEYILESAKGYRFMDTVSTGVVAEAKGYVETGYSLKSSAYTGYTAWQDEEIAFDKALINFEVDTREVEDTSKQRYKFSRYKYINDEGNTAYSYTAVDGYECTLEETYLDLSDPASSPVGFFEGNTSVFYWEINGEQWFNRTKVNGVKTQYRSRYTIETYYKWTEWGVVAPEYNETRQYETDTVYRYANKNYHVISIGRELCDIIVDILVEDGKCIPEEKIQSITGYDFVGLYTDETYENEFSLDTPITESLTLYAKYEPKEYTVTFQMEGGLELDTQTVKYMEAATAPDSFNIAGYVFGGWDKNFDCVTENMVVTGKYFKEEEYARISLNNTVYDMYQGNDTTLTYTISPADLSSESVEWSSSNPEIVSVDETGKITALSPGEATITAMVTKTREKATCVVTVNEDVSNFIIVKPASSLNHDSLGYLRRIGFDTTVASASKEFRNTDLLFYNISGTQLGEDDVVGTGTVIKLMNGEKVLDSETVIVTGDMTGDGLLNNRDVAMVNRYLVGKVEPQECQILALDLNGDGYINNKDAAMAARYLVGKEAII